MTAVTVFLRGLPQYNPMTMRLLGTAFLSLLACAQPPDFRGSFTAPLDSSVLRYSDPPRDDAIAQLAQRLETGQAQLRWDPKFGYLPAVLKALGIPAASQGLVFSKTSFQLSRISPSTPRAIYFNDDVYAGYVPGGDLIELSAADPERGGMFYSLEQKPSAKPAIRRREECLQCHASPMTTGVPGHLVRSVRTDAQGYPLMNESSYVTDHRSPWEQRWGGWYVHGAPPAMRHMGNQGAASFDTSRYLAPRSDVVALMVLEHQTKMHNLLARAGYEARSALLVQSEMNAALKRPPDELSETNARRLDHAAEIVVRYMLFADETPLPAPVRPTPEFAKAFAAQGPRDSAGRSLRDFDLTKRLFKYPCSYLIYSPDFARLPRTLKQRILQRIDAVLSGADPDPAYLSLTPDDRRSVSEILAATLTAQSRE